MLQLQNIVKDFGGLRVLDSLTLQVGEGLIFGLIGPNGAGKTTLFNIISGLSRPTAGRVIFNGTDTQDPVGYAEVSLTLSNKARVLPIEYDEVTVTR